MRGATAGGVASRFHYVLSRVCPREPSTDGKRVCSMQWRARVCVFDARAPERIRGRKGIENTGAHECAPVPGYVRLAVTLPAGSEGRLRSETHPQRQCRSRRLKSSVASPRDYHYSSGSFSSLPTRGCHSLSPHSLQ